MKKTFQTLATVAVAFAVAACGGGESTGSSNPTSTSVTGTVVKASGSSIDVNDTSFDISRASVRINKAPATAADLRAGMRVTVKGKTGGGADDTTTEVEAQNEVKGAVTAIDAATTSFNIGTTKVVTDANTVFDNLTPATFASIKVDLVVEVHGTRNAAGAVVATRVEAKKAAGAGPVDAAANEVHGAITAVGTSSVTVGTTVITITATTTFKPSTCTQSTLAVGTMIEAHGTLAADGSLAATSIECEAQKAAGAQKAEVEGLVAGLDAATSSFTVDTQAVKWSATTRFKKGAAADLANDARVRVKGTLDGTTLVATEIEIRKK